MMILTGRVCRELGLSYDNNECKGGLMSLVLEKQPSRLVMETLMVNKILEETHMFSTGLQC
jgi:hypothetical protein